MVPIQDLPQVMSWLLLLAACTALSVSCVVNDLVMAPIWDLPQVSTWRVQHIMMTLCTVLSVCCLSEDAVGVPMEDFVPSLIK